MDCAAGKAPQFQGLAGWKKEKVMARRAVFQGKRHWCQGLSVLPLAIGVGIGTGIGVE